jgi:predicted small integral membrane protein
MLHQLYWNPWAQAALVAACMALWAGIADWRRTKRRDINAVGFMPWTAISALSLLVSVLCAAIAFHQA